MLNNNPFKVVTVPFPDGKPNCLTTSNMTFLHKKMDVMVLMDDCMLYFVYENELQTIFNTKLKDNTYVVHMLPITDVKKILC